MKKRMKKFLALTLATALLTGSLAGCGEKASEPEATGSAGNTGTEAAGVTAGGGEETADGGQDASGKKIIKIGIPAKNEALNPFASLSGAGWITSPNYWECLGYDGEDGVVEPQIAKSWTTDDDLTYDIELYDYVYDWEGNHITADDVLFCFNTAKESGMFPHLGKMDSIEKTGDYTLRIVMNTDMLESFNYVISSVFIVSQKAYEESGDSMSSRTVGTGRYRITDFVPGSSMTLEKWDDYWQKEELISYRSSGYADEIQFITIPEEAQLAIALETGTIDVASLSMASADRFLNNDDYIQFINDTPNCYNIQFSGDESSICSDNVKLRQAVCYAIDTQALVDGAYNGYAKTVKAFGSPNVPGWLTKWENEDYYDYNPEKAKELLAEAGYKPGEVTLRLLIPSSDVTNTVATIMQAYLEEVGIHLEINSLEAALVSANAQDASTYDILYDNISSKDVVMYWTNKMNQILYPQGTLTAIWDDTLQAYLEGCNKPSNHTDENIDACHQYIKEQAYAYGLFCPQKFTFARKETGLTKIGYSRSGDMFAGDFQFE